MKQVFHATNTYNIELTIRAGEYASLKIILEKIPITHGSAESCEQARRGLKLWG